MEVFFAISPILVILICLFLLKQTAVVSSLAGFLFTLILVTMSHAFPLHGMDIGHGIIKGFLITSIVGYILIFGILLFHVMKNIGLIKSLAAFIASNTEDPVKQMLLLVVAFSPLVESVSGFGLAIIVVAPILLELGFSKEKAALLALVSMSAVPWGALGTGMVIGSTITQIPLYQIGAGTAILSIPVFFFFTFTAVFIMGGWKGFRGNIIDVFLLPLLFSAAIYLFSRYINVEIAGVFASMFVLIVYLLYLRVYARKTMVGKKREHHVLMAFSPYLFLVVILFLSRLLEPLEGLLTNYLVVTLPQYNFTLPLLFSPGFFVMLTCLFTIVLFQVPKALLKLAWKDTWKQWSVVMASMLGFIVTSELMTEAGMIGAIATAAAITFGSSYVFIAPLIGGLGGFLTGSNAAANAMLIGLQVEVADSLNMPREFFATIQNATAAHMTIASPTRTVLAISVCNAVSQESIIFRKIAVIALLALLLIILVTGILSFWVVF